MDMFDFDTKEIIYADWEEGTYTVAIVGINSDGITIWFL